MEALKRLRTTTKGRYTRGVNKLNRHIEEKRASLVEEIEELLGDVRRLFDSVMIKHENYIAHEEFTEDLEDSDAWLEEIENTFSKTKISVVNYKKEKEKENQRTQICNSIKILDVQYRHSVGDLEVAIEEKISVHSIKTNKEIVIKHFDLLKQSMMAFAEHSDEAKEAENLTKMLDEYSRVMLLADSALTEVLDANKRQEKSAMRLEKIALPKFDGNIRNFPQFLKDFKTLVLPT